jgi:hypothetical protein
VDFDKQYGGCSFQWKFSYSFNSNRFDGRTIILRTGVSELFIASRIIYSTDTIMSINLAVSYSHPAAIATQVSYARIDNTPTPVFTTLVPNLTGASGTFVIAQNIPDGQYQINAVPVYADGRTCPPTINVTPACPGLTSISAFITGGVIVVSYLAPPTAPQHG